MNSIPNIFIIGNFGVGKSTVGRELARILQRNFYDTDRLLEDRLGADIGWIIDLEGEERFFRREHDLLQELIKSENLVVATGGTTVFLPENRELLRQHGTVIALASDLEHQLSRTQHNRQKRPLLRGNDQADIESRLKEFRYRFEKVYREIAAITFITNHKGITRTVKDIVKYLEKHYPS